MKSWFFSQRVVCLVGGFLSSLVGNFSTRWLLITLFVAMIPAEIIATESVIGTQRVITEFLYNCNCNMWNSKDYTPVQEKDRQIKIIRMHPHVNISHSMPQ